jgi:hypothetical protein
VFPIDASGAPLDTTEAQSVVLKLSERRQMGGTVGMCEKEVVKRHTLLSTALLEDADRELRDVTGQKEAGETRSICLSAPEESMRRQPRLRMTRTYFPLSTKGLSDPR